ncbi:hypothetical protein BT93_F1923 [Corymbia citriodora subsp. variegata]|nr:hypothetical protein BT93_F1923 [Corymbia citriodora subsp. variegata]
MQDASRGPIFLIFPKTFRNCCVSPLSLFTVFSPSPNAATTVTSLSLPTRALPPERVLGDQPWVAVAPLLVDGGANELGLIDAMPGKLLSKKLNLETSPPSSPASRSRPPWPAGRLRPRSR